MAANASGYPVFQDPLTLLFEVRIKSPTIHQVLTVLVSYYSRDKQFMAGYCIRIHDYGSIL
jgi:hypothetical protein